MSVKIGVPGTCGELVQGQIDGVDFHISCPIALYSWVTVKKSLAKEGIKINCHATKTLAAVKQTLEYFSCQNLALEVEIESQLKIGKGMGSSTADIVAATLATAKFLNKTITDELIKDLALAIEPTDGSFFPGIVAFDHLQGQRLEKLGRIKAIPVLIFDVGGRINTVDFNRRTDLESLKLAKEKEVKRAYDLVVEGIKKGDKELIGRGATISSLANQNILNKPYLKELVALAEQDRDILGINNAHSGTLIGVLVNKEELLAEKLAKVKKELPALKHLATTKITNGGYRRG